MQDHVDYPASQQFVTASGVPGSTKGRVFVKSRLHEADLAGSLASAQQDAAPADFLIRQVAPDPIPQVEKLSPQPGDILLFRGPELPPAIARELRNAWADVLRSKGFHNLICYLPSGWSLSAISEDEMRQHGWVRAESIRSGILQGKVTVTQETPVPKVLTADYKPPSKQTQVMPPSEAPAPSIRDKCEEIRRRLEAKKEQGGL